MSLVEVAVWSATVGAIGLVALGCLADWATLRTWGAVQGVIYNLVVLAFVLVQSGLAEALLPVLDASALHLTKILLGPLCVSFGNYSVRAWLSARHRDRLMDVCLLGAAALAPTMALLAVLFLPEEQQLPASAVLVLLNTGIVLWISVRAWLLGDALALGIALGCLVMLPAVGGLYAMALSWPGLGVAGEAGIALASVLCTAVIGSMLWQRNQQQRRARGRVRPAAPIDPLTRLPGGLALVRQLLSALRRRRLTGRDGAVIAVILFSPERVVSVAGTSGLQEVYLHMAQRLQRQVGVVNPVGRYWDRCFVALVETIPGPSALRTLGLRVATSLRRPMEVSSENGGNVEIRLDIGVGVVHLGRQSIAAEDLLHEAQLLAEAARLTASRAVMRDPDTGEVVPVELARLAGRAGPPSTPPLSGRRARA